MVLTTEIYDQIESKVTPQSKDKIIHENDHYYLEFSFQTLETVTVTFDNYDTYISYKRTYTKSNIKELSPIFEIDWTIFFNYIKDSVKPEIKEDPAPLSTPAEDPAPLLTPAEAQIILKYTKSAFEHESSFCLNIPRKQTQPTNMEFLKLKRLVREQEKRIAVLEARASPPVLTTKSVPSKEVTASLVPMEKPLLKRSLPPIDDISEENSQEPGSTFRYGAAKGVEGSARAESFKAVESKGQYPWVRCREQHIRKMDAIAEPLDSPKASHMQDPRENDSYDSDDSNNIILSVIEGISVAIDLAQST